MRKAIFTPEVIGQIPVWVSQNMPSDEIAARIGCSLSTLKVRCSQLHISLRRPNWKECSRQARAHPRVGPNLPREVRSKPLPYRKPRPIRMATSLALSRVAMARLSQRAQSTGQTEAQLATALLEAIALDDLYDAVLDQARAA